MVPSKRKDGRPAKSEEKAARRQIRANKEHLPPKDKPKTLLEMLQWEADHDLIDELPEILPRNPEKAPQGRKSGYDRKVVAYMLQEIAGGRHVSHVCRDEGAYSYNTLIAYAESSPVIGAALTRAYEGFSISQEGEMLQISDNRNEDVVNTEQGPKININAIQRDKLRIDTREKILKATSQSRWAPRLLLGSDPKNPLPNGQKPLAEYTTDELVAAIEKMQAEGTIPDPEA